MAAVAPAGTALTFCGCFLPALDAARLDALGFARLAARLRVRRDARSACKQTLPGRAVDARHGGLPAAIAARGVFLRARLPPCGTHRAAGALQCGKRLL